MKIFIDRLFDKAEYPTHGCVFTLLEDCVWIQVGDKEIRIDKSEFVKISRLLD